jgi:hypothetical protein
MNNNNKKPIIQKIKLTKEQQEIADKLTKGIPPPTKKIITSKAGYTYEYTTNQGFSRIIAKKRLTEIYGGVCCCCGNWPDYSVLYNLEGAKRVERYCEKCYNNNKK